jgi:hypothetical protein
MKFVKFAVKVIFSLVVMAVSFAFAGIAELSISLNDLDKAISTVIGQKSSWAWDNMALVFSISHIIPLATGAFLVLLLWSKTPPDAYTKKAYLLTASIAVAIAVAIEVSIRFYFNY